MRAGVRFTRQEKNGQFVRFRKMRAAKRKTLRPSKDKGFTCDVRVNQTRIRGIGASICFVLLLARLLQPTAVGAESVVVRYPEGVAHGFLVLRTLDGKTLADGESTQAAQGDRVTNRMWFRFTDGSIYEQTTVFSQRGTFRLVSDHVLQKGPTFERPMETAIDTTKGQVTVRYTDHGKEKVLSERLEMPPDVANGMLFTVLKNVKKNVPKTTVSYVATTPKPRLVNLEVIPQGQEPFSIGRYTHKAMRYAVKVKIGGLAGAIAALLGKQPPNIQVWVLANDAPALVRWDGPLGSEGPVWRMELAIPAVWPDTKDTLREKPDRH
jgi:hypothetical protein